MKKLLVFMMVLAMTLSLAACGGEETTKQTTVEVPADQVKEQQALADADYEQLKTLVETTYTHEQNFKTQVNELTEKFKKGEAQESQLLEAYRVLSEESKSILEQVKSAKWNTEYYKEHVSLLTEAVEALAQAEQQSYEAGKANDDAMLEGVAGLFKTYQEKLDALLTLLGV